MSGDVQVGDSEKSLWDCESLLDPSPEDIVVDAAAKAKKISDVLEALKIEAKTKLEKTIAETRLRCEPKDVLSHNHKEIAARLKVSPAEVSRVEKGLVARLRNHLS